MKQTNDREGWLGVSFGAGLIAGTVLTVLVATRAGRKRLEEIKKDFREYRQKLRLESLVRDEKKELKKEMEIVLGWKNQWIKEIQKWRAWVGAAKIEPNKKKKPIKVLEKQRRYFK